MGQIIAKKFREFSPKIDIKKTKILEPEGMCRVTLYPLSFASEIDKIISNTYYKLSRKNRPKRKRIPAASSKNYK